MSIDLNEKVESPYFATVGEVIEYQAHKQITLNEPQDMCDDEAATRWVFSAKFKEGDRLEKLHDLAEQVNERWAALHLAQYGVPLDVVNLEISTNEENEV